MKQIKIISLICAVSFTLISHDLAAEDDTNKYYESSSGISNDGYWGSKRGHLGGEERVKEAPSYEPAEEPMSFGGYEFIDPDYSNFGFEFAMQSNYDDYNHYGLYYDYVLDDIMGEGIAWQSNTRKNSDTILFSNGLGVLPKGSDFPFGYNAFFDIDSATQKTRFSVGGKYADPVYAYTVSSNIYMPVKSGENHDDIVPSIDVRVEGIINPVLQFHSSIEYFRGDDIQVSRSYPVSHNSHKAVIGLDFTPIELLRIGVEAAKVKDKDVGYAAYINFNFNLWRSISDQLKPIVDIDFAANQLLPFSRSKDFARYQ